MATCQCPYEATHHREGQCQDKAVEQVERDGKPVKVCARCTLPGDHRKVVAR